MEIDEATSIIFEEAGKDANIIFGAVIDPALTEEILVTVIATGFHRKAIVEEIHRPQAQQKGVTPTQTRVLAEQENVPLHQKEPEEEVAPQQPTLEKAKSPLFFDDTDPPIYGNDLEVPAFIRRQHD
jgi:cell division protein FtsZ